ncbi:MAG: UbiX family flavin prenyltransferase [Nitrospinae bacterium]|nr:UbiX family flavin prenyltransferase [Nitrospinota bacterium]
MNQRRLVVGISGASGTIYGLRLLERLKEHAPEIHTILVISPAAARTMAIETDYTPAQARALAHECYDYDDLAAPISSGSFETLGMVVAPCSIKSLSEIAHCHAANLLARAADVTLKEGRRLVLLVRETPLHRGHLALMARAAENGAVILPPAPAFYTRPRTVDDLIDYVLGKTLDQLGIPHRLFTRWGEEGE